MSSDAAFQLLEWDSAFWGFPVARVSGIGLDGAELGSAVEWCDEHSVRCAYLLLDATDATGLAAAQRRGFRFVDTRIELRRDESPNGRQQSAGAVLRPAAAADLPALERLARRSFGSTRFFVDGRFDEERCRELYAAWIRRRADDREGLVMVAEQGGAPLGFMAGFVDRDGEGCHELMAVEPEHRRKGLGRALPSALSADFAARGVTRERMVTQAANVASLRVFGSLGFRVAKVQHWLHRWSH